MTSEPVEREATERMPSPRLRGFAAFARNRRATSVLLVIAAAAILYFGFGAFIAYTDDAYIQSDLVAIAPEVSGVIESVVVSDNQKVAAGDPLAAIDPTPYQLDVALKQSEVARLTSIVAVKSQALAGDAATLASAKAALGLAQDDFDRTNALAVPQYVSKADLDQASDTLKAAQDQVTLRQSQEDVGKSEVASAQADVAVAQAALAVAQYSLARTKLAAPVDGYVNNLTLRPGAYVQRGEAAIGIVDNSRWRVVANFKEGTAASVSPGQRVWVWLDSRPWKLWPGTVQGVGRGIARSETPRALLPYIAPTTDWIRLNRRLAVTILLDPPLPADALYMGADARVFLFR
jgi:multidrug efflux system membrane fusion protein